MNTLSPIKSLTIDDIQDNTKRKLPYIVMILDDWCPACQEFKPIVEFFAEKYANKIDFYIIRTENLSSLTQIHNFCNISSIPTTFFILGNTILSEVAGSMRFYDFKTAICNLMNFKVT